MFKTIRKILLKPERTIHAPPFVFEPSLEAAEKNLEVLNSKNMSLETVLQSSPFSVCSLGSEFRPVHDLQEIFQNHPKWTLLQSIFHKGAKYPMVELDEASRLKDVKEGMKRGNHYGAKIFKSELEKKSSKEIRLGRMLPLLPGTEMLLPHAEYCPTSMIEQMTIDSMGTFIEKKRPIHGQSFLQSHSQTSVNGRVHKPLLDECIYGHMLSRVVHYILSLRLRSPHTRILISKADLDSVYRRAHVDHKAAAKTITWFAHQDSKLLLLFLRLTFGGSPGPSLFSVISECLTDLVNAILRCEDHWDPTDLTSLLEAIMSETKTLPEDVPFAAAAPLSVNIPETAIAKSDFWMTILILASTPHQIDRDSKQQSPWQWMRCVAA